MERLLWTHENCGSLCTGSCVIAGGIQNYENAVATLPGSASNLKAYALHPCQVMPWPVATSSLRGAAAVSLNGLADAISDPILLSTTITLIPSTPRHVRDRLLALLESMAPVA